LCRREVNGVERSQPVPPDEIAGVRHDRAGPERSEEDPAVLAGVGVDAIVEPISVWDPMRSNRPLHGACKLDTSEL